MSTALVAFAAGTAWNAGGGRGWWRAQDGRSDAWLDPFEILAAQVCVAFATIEQHALLLAQRSGRAAGEARAVIERLLHRGLMIEHTALTPPPIAASPLLPEPLIAIRTFRRPAQLQRVLTSALEDDRRYGVQRRYLVIDDEDRTDAADARANRACIDAMRAQGLDIGCFGPDEREPLVEAIVARTGEPAWRGALSPVPMRSASGGRSWNWALLLGAGGSLSFVDDDCVFPLRLPEGAQQRWSLYGNLSNEGRFFDEALPELPIPAQEPFAAMRATVGQSPATIWHRDGVATNHYAGRAPADFAAWQPQRRIVAASGGIVGGHVYDSSVYFSMTDRRSLEHLLRPPFRLDRLDGDRIWQGVTASRMLSAAVYTPMLLDARELLPFTGTQGKADDTAFFGLLSAIEPEAVYAYLPLTIGHQPGEDRRRRENATGELLLDVNHYVAYVAHRCGQSLLGADRATRLRALAAAAADVTRMRDADFLADLQQWRGRNIAAVLAGLDEARRSAGPSAPAEWLRFLDQVERANVAAMQVPIAAARATTARAAVAQVATLGAGWADLWSEMASGRNRELLARCGLRQA